MFWEELLQTERPEGQNYWPVADGQGRYLGMASTSGAVIDQRACSNQQHAVEAAGHPVEVAEVLGVEAQAAGVAGQQGGGAFRGRGVAVQRVHRRARRAVEERRGVPAAAERAVQVGAPVPRVEEREALLKQDWDVAGHAGCE